RPSRQTTAATGWRAWFWPRYDRHKGRAGTPPLSRGQALDPVLHLAARAVELFVEVAGLVLLARQRGDDKPRIGLAFGPFRLGDDAALAAPAVARRPGEVPEAARRLPGLLALLGRFGEFGCDLIDQPAIARQAE